MESRGKRILKLLNDQNKLNSPKKDFKCGSSTNRDSAQESITSRGSAQQPSTSRDNVQQPTTSDNYYSEMTESSDEEDVSSSSEYSPSDDNGEDTDEQMDYGENGNESNASRDVDTLPNIEMNGTAESIKSNVFFEKRENVRRKVFEIEDKTCRTRKADNEEKETRNELFKDETGNNKASSTNIGEIHVTADDVQINVILENREKAKKKAFEPKTKIFRKRIRHQEQWKRKKSAIFRQAGKEYISQNGKIMPKKNIKSGLLCKEKCRLTCTAKFNLEAREAILKKFYALDINAKNSILFKSIEIKPVARHRTNARSQKQHSFTYSVTYGRQVIPVCKDAFCALHQIGRKKIELVQKYLKTGQSAPTPDKQGRHYNRPHRIGDDVVTCITNHIQQFPAEDSHYSRNKNHNKQFLSPQLNVSRLHQLYINQCKESKLDDKFMVKLSMYRHIFETKFNLSFGHPKSDTCSVCDAGENTTEHTENFKFAYERLKTDRQKPLINKNTCYITMDLQQTMPLPKLSTSKAFYLRQMWLYNFGVHCISHTGRKSYFFTWTEDAANRGSNEIASCLFKFCKLLKEENPEIDHLIVWSDSCGGQNKNFFILCLYQYLILNEFFKIIEHKFPEVGHSYLDSDKDFGRIEKVVRKRQNIFIPDQYRELIKSASTKNSVCFNMEHFFYNFEELPGKLHLFKKEKNTMNAKINFRDSVKWIRVEQLGYYFYKTSLDDFSPFLQVDLRKKGSRVVNKGEVRPTRFAEKTGGLTVEKMANLKEQIKFVEEEYRWFYENILEENVQNPKKKRKTY